MTPTIYTTKDGGHVIRETNVYVKELRDVKRLETAKAKLYEMTKSLEMGEDPLEQGQAFQLYGNTWAVYAPEAESHFEFFEAD